jgi:hypothetical protein
MLPVSLVARGFSEESVAHGVEDGGLAPAGGTVDQKERPLVEKAKVQMFAAGERPKSLDA